MAGSWHAPWLVVQHMAVLELEVTVADCAAAVPFAETIDSRLRRHAGQGGLVVHQLV